MLFKWKKNKDLQAIERTLKLLQGFHAVPPNNEQFLKRYHYLLQLKALLQKEIPDVS